jgi:hypothetical protein
MPGRKELRNIRLKRETANGTPVSPRFIYRGNGEMIEDAREVKKVEMQVGVFDGTDETYIPKLMAHLDLAETEATFEQLPDLFLMSGFGTSGGNVAGSAQGANGSTTVFTLIPPTTLVFPTYSYTVEAGNGTASNDGWTEFMPYTLCEELNISGKGGEALKVSASLTGQYGTATNAVGSFTNIGTLPSVEAILAGAGSFWISPVGSGWGSQQVTAGNILAFEISYKTTWAFKYPVDSGLLTYATAVFAGQEITGKVTLEAQSSGTYGAWGSAAQKEKWRQQVPQLLTATWNGGTILNGTTFANKSLTIAHPIKWEKMPAINDMDGNDILEGEFFSRFNQATPAGGRGTVTIVRQGTSEFAGA